MEDKTKKQNPLQLLSIADLNNLPKPNWLVGNYFTEKSVVVLYGPSGAGKSFLAIDWALSIASGNCWKGQQVSPGYVVFIAAEGIYGIRKRTEAWVKHQNTEVKNVSFLPQAINMLDPEQVDLLIEKVISHQESLNLIVIDTLARCMMGGDENSARDMGKFMSHVDTLKEKTGATILIVHHTGKKGDYERGSSALRAAADTMISLSVSNGILTVECDKQKL